MTDPQFTTPATQQGPRAIRLTANQVEVPCVQCGKPLYYFPAQLKSAKRHFCGRLCLGRWRSQQTDTKGMHWKGGEKVEGGRVYWALPWHPRADKKGYVARAIIVAELALGRGVLPGEIVHHKDEDKSNDHPDNLQVLANQSEHARLHSRLEGWSKHYESCTACGTTERKHEGHGLCSRCFQRAKRKAA